MSHNKSRFRAYLIELYTRVIKVVKDKDKEVYWNGEDNLYPNEIERVINNSPTASRAAKVMAKFIGGKGLVNENEDIIVNEFKNYRLSNIISLAADDIAKQYGCFIHVGYGFDDNANIVPKTLDVLDYVNCRISKEDDDEWEGKIYYKDYTEKQLSFASKKKDKCEEWYYPFNPNKDVVMAQIAKDSDNSEDLSVALRHYRGQVFYLNLTPKYKYALPPVDSVFNDADTEFRISVYTNSQTREGFLGKTVALINGLDDEESESVEKDLKQLLGAENSGNILALNVDSPDLDNVLKFVQLKAQFDDKLFETTNKSLRSKILGAFNNIPEPLILAGDGALFGTNGEAYEQMKLFYSEQTEDERYKLSETLTYLGFPCEIKPIIEKKDANTV